ncbi:YbdD/YjiX family protein [Williamsia sp. CHRR-6]|nr:YbdD/YjiX family protein [Williamsia sp. CHRR-6]
MTTWAARVARSVRDYVRAVLGEDHYQRYLEHHARRHPGEPAMTVGEYWRTRHSEQERNPATRCC